MSPIRTIAASGIIASGIKLGGVVRDTLLIWVFQATDTTDAYFLSCAITAIIWHGITVGISTSSLGLLANANADSPESLSRLTTALSTRAIAVGIIAALLLMAAVDASIRVGIAAENSVLQRTLYLTRTMALSFPMSALAAVQLAALQIAGRRLFLVIAPGANVLAGLIGVLAANYTRDLHTFVIFGILGWLAQVVMGRCMLPAPATPPCLLLHHPLLRGSTRMLLSVAGINVLQTGVDMVVSCLALSLCSGSLTLYSFAKRLTSSAGSLAVTVTSAVFYSPLLTAHIAGTRQKALKLTNITAAVMTGLTVSCLLVLILGARALQHLQVTDDLINLRQLTQVLAVMAAGTLSAVILELWIRLATVSRCGQFPLLNAASGSVVTLLYLFLMHKHLSVIALSLGVTIGQFFTLSVALVAARRYFNLPLSPALISSPFIGALIIYAVTNCFDPQPAAPSDRALDVRPITSKRSIGSRDCPADSGYR